MKSWRERIEELRAMRAAATQGEWADDRDNIITVEGRMCTGSVVGAYEVAYQDRDFIIEAANSFPAILDALQTAMEALELLSGRHHLATDTVAKTSRILAGEET